MVKGRDLQRKRSPAAVAMWEKHRKKGEADNRQRERAKRLQEATVVKDDQALIEEALAQGRVTKCSPGSAFGLKKEGEQ
jgi:hypothetical protein